MLLDATIENDVELLMDHFRSRLERYRTKFKKGLKRLGITFLSLILALLIVAFLTLNYLIELIGMTIPLALASLYFLYRMIVARVKSKKALVKLEQGIEEIYDRYKDVKELRYRIGEDEISLYEDGVKRVERKLSEITENYQSDGEVYFFFGSIDQSILFVESMMDPADFAKVVEFARARDNNR